MSQFHNEETHKAFVLLFDSCKIEHKFKSRSELPYTVITGEKEERRLASMLTSVGEIGILFKELQHSAIACVAIAKSEDEAIAIGLGLIKIVPQGLAICTGCLDRAIKACEENLAVLKDIQEATKAYAK